MKFHIEGIGGGARCGKPLLEDDRNLKWIPTEDTMFRWHFETRPDGGIDLVVDTGAPVVKYCARCYRALQAHVGELAAVLASAGWPEGTYAVAINAEAAARIKANNEYVACALIDNIR